MFDYAVGPRIADVGVWGSGEGLFKSEGFLSDLTVTRLARWSLVVAVMNAAALGLLLAVPSETSWRQFSVVVSLLTIAVWFVTQMIPGGRQAVRVGRLTRDAWMVTLLLAAFPIIEWPLVGTAEATVLSVVTHREAIWIWLGAFLARLFQIALQQASANKDAPSSSANPAAT